MTSPITRATDHHNVMAAIGKPKPTKQPKQKRVPAEKRRKRLEKQIAEIGKAIMYWRDGQVCVMSEIDGGRCGNGLMWNHVISQSQSHYLQLDIGNFYCGCGNHNLLDFHGDKTLTLWFVKKFGVACLEALQLSAREHKGQKRTEYELEEMLACYDELYQSRFTTDLDLQSLIYAGFYGDIVKGAYE